MNAKEYLSQARFLDLQIASKLEQIQRMNELATRTTAVYSDMPTSGSKDNAKMAKTVEKMVDLEKEIDGDIDRLIDLKKEITDTITQVQNQEYQCILQRRYLNFEKWEQIAVEMALDLRWVYRRHGMALAEVQKILAEKEIRH